MKLWHWIIGGIIIAGLFSGTGALEAGAAAQPPIEWSDIPFMVVGSLFGMLFIGASTMRSNYVFTCTQWDGRVFDYLDPRRFKHSLGTKLQA